MNYVIALLWAWLAENPEYYCSWVPPHVQLRFNRSEAKHIATRVGGHWRRREGWGKIASALGCVCRFERLVVPKGLGTPMHAMRLKWDEDGNIVPRRYRVLVWA